MNQNIRMFHYIITDGTGTKISSVLTNDKGWKTHEEAITAGEERLQSNSGYASWSQEVLAYEQVLTHLFTCDICGHIIEDSTCENCLLHFNF